MVLTNPINFVYQTQILLEREMGIERNTHLVRHTYRYTQTHADESTLNKIYPQNHTYYSMRAIIYPNYQ